jgi:Zn-dependent metalloprotease
MDRGSSRHPLLCIVPPYLLAHMARLSDPRLKRVAEAAMRTLVLSERLRGQRHALGEIAPLAATPTGTKRRTIFDARQGGTLPGELVRGESDAPGKDPAVNEAYDGLGATYDLFWERFGRRSIDGKGMRLDATVHYRRLFNNAFWNGRQMVFGDGDGVIFGRFTRCLDVIGHELTHGVTQFEAGLEYQGQPGALNESVSDVFGSLVKQNALGQSAEEADWLIGAGLFMPSVKGRALRSMKDPGTAYDDPRLGKDPQPAHMKHYVETEDDSGGVHINSGIPNRAFCLAALGFGGPAWRKAGSVWYLALTDLLGERASFADAAEVTTAVAGRELGKDAAEIVRGAWNAVGVRPRAPRAKSTPVFAKDGHAANSNRGKRRIRRAAQGARG